MAYAGNLSTSLTQDSDEIKEMHCEQCEKHACIYEVASGFCVDCVEYMCATCLVYHKRYVPGHKQLNKDTMPQDFCFEKCFSHPNQLIKFYCETCDTFACVDCKANKHPACKNMAHLPTVVKGVEHSKELQDLIDNIDQVSEEIDENKTQLDSNIKYVDALATEANSIIVKHRDELVRKFNKQQQSGIEDFDKKMQEIIENLRKERQEKVDLAAERQKRFESKIRNAEKDITRKVKATKSMDQTKMQSLLQKSTSLETEVKSLKSDIDQKKKIMQRCHIFMKMKSANKTVEQLQKEMDLLQSKVLEIQPFKVETVASESTTEQLETKGKFFLIKEMHKSSRRRSASFHFEIDLHPYRTTSMCSLFEKQLLVVDQKKESLLILKDIKEKNTSFDVVKLSSGPSDIANLEQDMAAVTLPNLGVVKLLSFSQKTVSIVKTDEMAVGRGCHGIASCQGKLVVCFFNPAKIQVLDRSGKVLITLDNDSQNMPLFSCPRYLAVSPDHTILYVSDSYRSSVTGMKFDGTIENIYKDKELSEPAKLAVDSYGSVFVCGCDSSNVHQLSNDLTKVTVLLDRAQGIREPQSIFYLNENRLLVGMSKKESIKVFKITHE